MSVAKLRLGIGVLSSYWAGEADVALKSAVFFRTLFFEAMAPAFFYIPRLIKAIGAHRAGCEARLVATFTGLIVGYGNGGLKGFRAVNQGP